MSHSNIKWYEHDKSKIRGYWLKEPYNNIFIGCDPRDGMTKELACSFQAIVNVSDTECAYFEPAYEGQRMHWYPINEIGYWGYACFFYIKKVLDYHYDKGDKIYLHCHAGAYRSPTMAVFWLISRGLDFDTAVEIGDGIKRERLMQSMSMSKETMLEFTKRRYFDSYNVPRNIFKFYEKMNANKRYSLCSHLVENPCMGYTREVWGDAAVIAWKHAHLKWYYSVKYFMHYRKEYFKIWMSGNMRFNITKGSYSTKERPGILASIQRMCIRYFKPKIKQK